MTHPRTEARHPPILQNGFRPFFLGAAVFAAVAVPLWIAAAGGYGTAPGADGGLGWHVHEMLFGYLGAVLTGFLFTAIPNWTGRLPLAGSPLAALFALWLAGRAAVAAQAWLGAAAAIVDAAFLLVVTALAVREVTAGRNWRNLPVCVLVGVFTAANVLFWIDWPAVGGSAVGWRLGLAVAVILIALIGGRITPSFTRNWLAKREADEPAPFSPFDRAVLLVLVATMAAWVAAPDAAWTGGLAVVAGVLHLARAARWRGWTTLAEPLVTVLHLGYLWVPVGLLILGAVNLGWSGLGPTAALHALSAGAIGTMTLAVMTRASLGHTGRPLTAGPATAAIYAAVLAGAALRVAAPVLPLDYLDALALSGGLWSGAFALFAIVYGPMLARPRPGRG